jgi:hypothetical protein
MASNYTRNFDAKFDESSGRFEDESKERAKVRFWIDEVLNPRTNNLDKIEMIEIRVPGEDKNIWAGKVENKHRQRFGRAYQFFKSGQEMPVNGHPLDKLPGITAQLLTDLRYMGFTSVEDLSRATDQAIGQFHGGLTWRRKAQLWLDEQKAIESKVNDSSAKDALIAEQGEALKALQAQMAEMSAMMAERKKPGPKPKSEQVAA